jgi:hypothetical protein
MEYFSVRNLERYQHYSKRNPPWVKLHKEFLTDYQLRSLPIPSRLLFVCTWLLAAEMGNKIPLDYTYLSHRVGFPVTKKTLAPLVSANALSLSSVSVSDSSLTENSTLLATCVQDASKPLARATPFPEHFAPDARSVAMAEAFQFNPHILFTAFRDHHLARGTTFKDWQAAFRTWIRNEKKFKEGRS